MRDMEKHNLLYLIRMLNPHIRITMEELNNGDKVINLLFYNSHNNYLPFVLLSEIDKKGNCSLKLLYHTDFKTLDMFLDKISYGFGIAGINSL